MITDSSSAGKCDVVAIGVAPAETAAQVHSNKEIDSNEKHFRTDHLLTNLKGRAVSSAFITIAAQGAQFVLSLGSIMVLARLLTPKDFGLFAMVTTVMGFLRVFKDAGLSTATVQREKITHAQISNLFWINIAMSGTAANWLFASQGRGKDWLFAGSLLSGIAVASFVADIPSARLAPRSPIPPAGFSSGCPFISISQDGRDLSLRPICGSEFSNTFRFGNCLRRDLVDAPTFRELRSVGAIGHLRPRWSHRRTNFDLYFDSNATDGTVAR